MILSVDTFFLKQIPLFTSPLILICPSLFNIHINYAGMAVKWIVFHFNYSFKCCVPGKWGSVLAHGLGIFLLLVWFWIGVFWGGRSGLGGFLGFFCWFVFGFVLGFIFSEEAQISFDGSSVLCFVWHFLRAVLFRYKSSVYSLSIHTCKFY